jgi:carbonic anhydrase
MTHDSEPVMDPAAMLASNRRWAQDQLAGDPEFFRRLVNQQSPRFLWIGCSDSRVPANQIVDVHPGEIFVHRNIANVVVHTDLNCLSVIQYAVDVLQVEHILVVGHYGCGGIAAAAGARPLGLIDNWLRHIQDIASRHQSVLDRVSDEAARLDRLGELNVLTQVVAVCRTTMVQDAWRRGQSLTVHGWIYRLKDGLIRDLSLSQSGSEGLSAGFERAVAAL